MLANVLYFMHKQPVYKDNLVFKIKKYASSFDVRVMKGVGHEMQNADPDQFNRLLENILSGFER